MDCATTLFGIGVALDVIGLLLVAAGDWLPITIDFARATRERLASTWRRVRARLRREPIVVSVGAASGISLASNVRVKVSPGEDASLEQRVEFLLRRVDDLQTRLDDLAETVAGQPAKWSEEIASTRAELEARMERRLTETQERYLGARQVGLVFLLASFAFLIGSQVLC